VTFEFDVNNLLKKMERATRLELATFSLGSEFSILYFHHLQNRSRKMYVHALHTVHALPDLRVAAGHWGDGPLG